MAVTAHAFPSFTQVLGSKAQNIGTDDVNVALIGNGNFLSTTYTSTIEAMVTWTNVKANGASALTEVANGSGYTTGGLLLSHTNWAIADSGTTSVFTTVTYSGTIQWTSATFTAYQAVFYFVTTGNAICYWDFGGAQSCSSGTFTLTLGTANSVSNAVVQYSHT